MPSAARVRESREGGFGHEESRGIQLCNFRAKLYHFFASTGRRDSDSARTAGGCSPSGGVVTRGPVREFEVWRRQTISPTNHELLCRRSRFFTLSFRGVRASRRSQNQNRWTGRHVGRPHRAFRVFSPCRERKLLLLSVHYVFKPSIVHHNFVQNPWPGLPCRPRIPTFCRRS